MVKSPGYIILLNIIMKFNPSTLQPFNPALDESWFQLLNFVCMARHPANYPTGINYGEMCELYVYHLEGWVSFHFQEASEDMW